MIKNIFILILLAITTYFVIDRAFNSEETKESDMEMMSITVFIQDKEAARTSDCSITVPVVYEIPKTQAVLDASLKTLFEEELVRYGTYESVEIVDTTARVNLATSDTQSGASLSSLSSCEVGHLTSVLTDTLTQYDGFDSVEIYSPEGLVEF